MRPSRLGLTAVLTTAVLAAAHGAAQAQTSHVSVTALAGFVGSATVVQGVTEQGAGLWYGVRGELRLGLVDIEASGLQGELAPEAGASGFKRDGGEIRGAVRLNLAPWVALEGGYAIRAFKSAAGYQKWAIPALGARVSARLGTPGLVGYVRGAYLPSATSDGLPSSTLGLAVEAGLRLEPVSGWLSLGASYRLERLDFGSSPGSRLEQFDVLAVSVGLRL